MPGKGKITGFLLAGVVLCLILTAIPVAGVPDEQNAWTRAAGDSSFTPRSGHSSVVFQDRIWITGGNSKNGTGYNDVWSSADGIEWRMETPHAAFSPRSAHRSVVIHDRIWVIGGRDASTKNPLDDVWYSSDGITWNRATGNAAFTPRWDFGIAAYDDRIWVIGGTQDGIISNDVWYSSDGISWTQATSDAGFSKRMNPAAATYDGRLFVVGGFDWKNDFNDVWSSADGIAWTRETPHAAFGERRYHTLETDGRWLYVLGGVKDYPLYSYQDIWRSEDGKTWEQLKTTRSFPEGYSQSSVTFDDRIWVIGALGNGNEVWYLPITTIPGLQKSGSPATPMKVQKTASPVSIKQGMTTRISITLTNTGPLPLYDIQVLDPVIPEFPRNEGSNQQVFASLQPGETRIITYTVVATKAGSHTLEKASVMYADSTGNYQVIQSNKPGVRVIAPLINDPSPPSGIESEINRVFSDLDAFFAGIFA